MHIDIEDLDHDSVVETQICVIGAGAAGVTITRRLVAEGARVVLLESGGPEYESRLQDLNRGDVEGLPYYPLERARLRFFGGTTAIWGGRSASLDAIDLEQRAWVPHSGWPLRPGDLFDWYPAAWEELGLREPVPEREIWHRLGLEGPGFDSNRVRCGLWQFDAPPGRFALGNCQDLIRSTRAAILTHATAVRLRSSPSGERIREVEVANLAGHRAHIRARYFVLAAGGLENPRLLLNSDDVQPDGLGNDRGLVGRFFMEHPHGRGGRVVATEPWKLLRWFARRHTLDGRRVAVYLRPGEVWQRRHQGLNSALTLACRPHPDQRLPLATGLYRAAKHHLQPSRMNRRLWLGLRSAARALQAMTFPLKPWLRMHAGRSAIYAVLRAEQSPNPSSRVRLGEQRDALGLRRLQLDWRLTDLDRHGARVALESLDAELRRLRLGRVEPAPWLLESGREWEFDPLVSAHPIGGFHHMGTTRMASDPSRGVVDPDCRVFGLDNLYVAGSSVFPTGGWANPTLTLIALSLRLAARLADLVRDDALTSKSVESPFERATA